MRDDAVDDIVIGVSCAHITGIEPLCGFTQIRRGGYFPEDEFICIRESFDEIMARLNGESERKIYRTPDGIDVVLTEQKPSVFDTTHLNDPIWDKSVKMEYLGTLDIIQKDGLIRKVFRTSDGICILPPYARTGDRPMTTIEITPILCEKPCDKRSQLCRCNVVNGVWYRKMELMTSCILAVGPAPMKTDNVEELKEAPTQIDLVTGGAVCVREPLNEIVTPGVSVFVNEKYDPIAIYPQQKPDNKRETSKTDGNPLFRSMTGEPSDSQESTSHGEN